MRTYSPLATDEVKILLDELVGAALPDAYRRSMTQLGEAFGKSLNGTLSGIKHLLLICTNEDADFLARGVKDGIHSRKGPDVSVACFWNDRVKLEGKSDLQFELAPIVRKYVEPGESDAFLVVKSIISTGCVVRTNITELIQERNPSRVLIFAPVIFKGADNQLKDDFEPDIARRFEFFYFRRTPSGTTMARLFQALEATSTNASGSRPRNAVTCLN
ncbi:MAG: hypothetical protein R3B84_09785 [Zavarzinella sp.]